MSGGLSDNAGMHTSTGRVSLIRRRLGKGEIFIENAELEPGVLSPLRNVIVCRAGRPPATSLVAGCIRAWP
jgi:hypothetical protein